VLAQTLVLLATSALLAASAVAGIAGVARAQTVAAAKALIVPAIETALGDYQRLVARTIGAQIASAAGDPTVAPAPVAALNGGTAWPEQHALETPAGAAPLAIAVDIVPTAQSLPTCDGNANAGPDLALQLQCSAIVQESRLSLTVQTAVGPLDAGGTVSPLAQNRFTVTMRLFAQAPYAIVSGAKDAAEPTADHEGDTAGWGNALAAFASPPPDDTTIHVVYSCTAGTGACATSNPPPADAPTSTPWTNGNGLP